MTTNYLAWAVFTEMVSYFQRMPINALVEWTVGSEPLRRFNPSLRLAVAPADLEWRRRSNFFVESCVHCEAQRSGVSGSLIVVQRQSESCRNDYRRFLLALASVGRSARKNRISLQVRFFCKPFFEFNATGRVTTNYLRRQPMPSKSNLQNMRTVGAWVLNEIGRLSSTHKCSGERGFAARERKQRENSLDSQS